MTGCVVGINCVRQIYVGKTVMIVAHANSLRGIIKHIDNISKDQIKNVVIPNGIPLVYKFDKNMKPVKLKGSILCL